MSNDLDGRFPTTRWSLVARGREGLSALYSRYRPAMVAHLVFRKRCRAEEAEDLVQGFVTSQLLEKDLVGGADQSKGRFRTYLLTALDRYLSNARRDSMAKKRSAGSPMVSLDGASEPTAQADPAAPFETEWARQILRRTLELMESECCQGGRSDVWLVFEARLLKPLFEDIPAPPYEALMQIAATSSPAHAANLLITGKRMFARHIRQIISEYADSDEAIELELQELMQALGA